MKVRRPALRGTAPSALLPPTGEVAAAAAPLLSVDLDQPSTLAGSGEGEGVFHNELLCSLHACAHTIRLCHGEGSVIRLMIGGVSAL